MLNSFRSRSRRRCESCLPHLYLSETPNDFIRFIFFCGFLGDGGFILVVLVFAPKRIRHPPAGDAGHSSLLRQRRLTRRKPTLPGAEQSRALGVLVSSYGNSSACICRYRFEGPRHCQFPGCVVRPPVAEPLPIRQSAVTGAERHDTSHRDGFVVGWARW